MCVCLFRRAGSGGEEDGDLRRNLSIGAPGGGGSEEKEAVQHFFFF